MRARLSAVFLALVLATLPAPTALAEDPALATLAEDPASDVRIETQAGPQDSPDQVHTDVDLRSLTLQEGPLGFTLTVQATDIKLSQEGAGEDGAVVTIQFTHAGRQFQAVMFHTFPGVGDFIGAALLYRDAADAPWSELWFRPNGASIDPAANTYSVTLLRSELADAQGAPPYPGRVFESFLVQSSNNMGDGRICCIAGQGVDFPGQFADTMPDAGPTTAGYAVQLGLKQEGSGHLSSAEPFRASNGEATTFIYSVIARNVGDTDDRYQLRTPKLPSGWSVVLPVPTVDLPAGGEQEVPVVATVPFVHAHGSAASFVLELASMTDPGSVGRLEMGVRYLTIPQPAGHHNQVFFHSRTYNELSTAFGAVFSGNDGYAFLNTVEDYEGDAAVPLSPQNVNWDFQDEPQGIFQWCIPLDPTLQMGLDFKTGESAHVSAPVHVTAPLNGASLSAQLMLLPADANRWGCFFGDEPRLIATLNGTAPVDITANTDRVLEGDLDVWPNADRIQYDPGQNLYLLLEVRGVAAPNFLAPGTPRLVPGGRLDLPLLEYHDDIKDVLTTVEGPSLTPLGPQERLANPGATILFPVSVSNDGSEARVIAFNVTGPNSAWAQLPPGAAVEVAAHSTARADIVVNVPVDAKDGDVADLVVQGFDAADQTGRGLLRLVVTVQTGVTLEDDSALAPKADTPRDSPAWAPIGLLAVLGFVALLRRRTA